MTLPHALAVSVLISTPSRLAMNPTQFTVTSAKEALFLGSREARH